MINSKLFLSELELITLADDFLLCVNKTRRQSSCFAAHSTVKLTRGKAISSVTRQLNVCLQHFCVCFHPISCFEFLCFISSFAVDKFAIKTLSA